MINRRLYIGAQSGIERYLVSMVDMINYVDQSSEISIERVLAQRKRDENDQCNISTEKDKVLAGKNLTITLSKKHSGSTQVRTHPSTRPN